MGTIGAQGFAELVSEGNIGLAVALEWHLQSNHFPAVDRVWVPVAIKAIEAGNEEDWDLELERPEGYGEGRPITAAEVIDGLHLDSFITWLD